MKKQAFYHSDLVIIFLFTYKIQKIYLLILTATDTGLPINIFRFMFAYMIPNQMFYLSHHFQILLFSNYRYIMYYNFKSYIYKY